MSPGGGDDALGSGTCRMNFLFNRFNPSVESAQPSQGQEQRISLCPAAYRGYRGHSVPTWQGMPLLDGLESRLFRPLVFDSPFLDKLVQQEPVHFLIRVPNISV
jgi:hypothetical protein